MPIQSEKVIFSDLTKAQSAPDDSVPVSAGVTGANLLQKLKFTVDSGHGSAKVEFYVYLLGVWTKVTGDVTVTASENDKDDSNSVVQIIKNTSSTDIVLPVLTSISGIGAKASLTVMGSAQ